MKPSTLRLCASLASLTVFVRPAWPAQSGIIFFTSQSAFQSAAGNSPSFGFANVPQQGYGTAAGLTVNGVTFVGTTGSGYSLGVQGPNFYGNDYDHGLNEVSVQGPARTSAFYNITNGVTTITFAQGVTAFGLNLFDVLTGDSTGAGTDLVNLNVNGFTGSVTTPQYTGAAFIGFTSSTPISSVTLTGTAAEEFPTIVEVFSRFTASASIGTTGGDIAPNVFSLGSAAAQSNPIVFDGGTLRVMGGTFSGNIVPTPVTIDTNNGTVDTSTGNGGFSGSVSGPGSLTIEGGGTFALGGANSYGGGTTVIGNSTLQAGTSSALGSGALTINVGTLQAGAGALSLANPVVLAGSGTVDTQAYDLSIAGAISGTGQMTKIGVGTLSLSGNNTYSGATAIASGTLRAGSTTALSPNSSFIVAGGAVLDLAGFSSTLAAVSGAGVVTNSNARLTNLTIGGSGASTTYGGALTDGIGAISLTKTGSSTLTLTGASSYSGGTFLDGGVLALGNAAALGSGQLNLAPGTALAAISDLTVANAIAFTGAGDPTFDTGPNTLTVSGGISGPGNLTKIGAGTLDLTGTNTYTGTTDVAQGTLLVDGSIANSAVMVKSGALLGGSGTIGSLDVLSGATLSPGVGSRFSTLTVAGDATLQSGSTFLVNIGATGQSDRLNVRGLATINNAALTVNAIGTGFTPNTRYTLLTAGSGVSGQFGTLSAVSPNLAFLSPSISYTPGTVDLTFSQGAPLSAAAATPNQRAVAAAIDSLGPGIRLYDAVVGLDAVGARQAFQAASGETHASATTTSVQSTRVVSSIVFDRLWNLPIPQAGDALDALKQFEPHNIPTLLNCYAPTTAPATGVRQGSGYTVWGQAIGDFGHTGSDGNAASVDRTLGGFVLGIDSRIDATALQNWRVGMAGGYTNTQFSVKSGGGGTIENAFGTLYAGTRYGNVTLRFGGTYGGTQTNASRAVAFPGFFETERSNNGGDTAQAFGEIGYRISTPAFVVEPIFNGAITHAHQDGYREKGGDAALVGAAQNVDVGSTVLGFRSEMLPFGKLPIVARLFLGWQHTYGDINPAAVLAFAAGGPSFSSYGTPLDRNAVVAEAGLDWRVTAAVSVGLTYFGQTGERSTDNAVKGRLEYRF